MHMDSHPEHFLFEMTVLITEPTAYVLHLPVKFSTAEFIVSHQNAKWARVGKPSATMWLCQHKPQPCAIMKLESWVFLPNSIEFCYLCVQKVFSTDEYF